MNLDPAVTHIPKEMGPPSSPILIQWTFGPGATLKHAPIDLPIPQDPPHCQYEGDLRQLGQVHFYLGLPAVEETGRGGD